MTIKEDPIITDYKGEPYTKITFLPDYRRFGLENITDDLFDIYTKRVYDSSMWFSGNMNLTLNPKLKKKENECKCYFK